MWRPLLDKICILFKDKVSPPEGWKDGGMIQGRGHREKTSPIILELLEEQFLISLNISIVQYNMHFICDLIFEQNPK